MIAATGANGHLGQLAIEGLVERVPANQILQPYVVPGILGVKVLGK
jgi:hypothetical protein